MNKIIKDNKIPSTKPRSVRDSDAYKTAEFILDNSILLFEFLDKKSLEIMYSCCRLKGVVDSRVLSTLSDWVDRCEYQLTHPAIIDLKEVKQKHTQFALEIYNTITNLVKLQTTCFSHQIEALNDEIARKVCKNHQDTLNKLTSMKEKLSGVI